MLVLGVARGLRGVAQVGERLLHVGSVVLADVRDAHRRVGDKRK